MKRLMIILGVCVVVGHINAGDGDDPDRARELAVNPAAVVLRKAGSGHHRNGSRGREDGIFADEVAPGGGFASSRAKPFERLAGRVGAIPLRRMSTNRGEACGQGGSPLARSLSSSPDDRRFAKMRERRNSAMSEGGGSIKRASTHSDDDEEVVNSGGRPLSNGSAFSSDGDPVSPAGQLAQGAAEFALEAGDRDRKVE